MEADPLTGEGFPPAARLRLSREFQRCFEQGTKTVQQDIILWSRLRGDGGPARLGVVASRKLGDAVFRNRMKRLTREAFRRGRPEFEPGADVVVLLRPGACRWPGQSQADAALRRAWKKAGILKA